VLEDKGRGYKVCGGEIFEECAEEFVEFVAALPHVFCVGGGIAREIYMTLPTKSRKGVKSR
jgi:hypothetical protein